MTWQAWSVAPIWFLALVGSVLVGIFAPDGREIGWLSIVLAILTILTFWVQLGIQRKEGFVQRATVSIAGALLILAAASGILALF